MSVWGTPVATDPITGQPKTHISYLDVAREGGWVRGQVWDGWVFEKDGRTLHVRTWEGSNTPTSGVIHEPLSCGMFIEAESIKPVLFGTKCICPTKGVASGREVTPDPDCPLKHWDPFL